MSSFLRIPDVPLTPARLARARSSGSTMVDSEPSDALVLASVADPDASWSAEVSVVTELDSL
jgi:hypothetical protein